MLTHLNERQILAATTTEGFVRIVAGAGSGKTRVLAYRYAYLVNDIGIAPGNILCMTFTNKAAQTMKARISALTDRGNVNDLICTLHGFCVKFLRREIYRIGYPKTFTIIDETDAKDLAKAAMEEFGMDRRKTTAERFLKSVAGFKGLDPDAYIQKHLLPGADTTAPDAIVRYLQYQLKHFALDFDDLLYFTLYILRHFEEARLYWTDKLNYILVDETQDCSSDDWALMRELAKGHHNLFVVGDPDQAIYEWRGAKPRLFVDFNADTTVILDRNYRSTPTILEAANAIIANNRVRIPKDLFSTLPDGPHVVHYHAPSDREEAEYIADLVQKGLSTKGANLEDFAILYRASHVSRAIEQALLKRKIPYTIWGGVRFFERREIKDILAYLRLILNPADDLAFTRIVNLPARGFGKATLAKLRKCAEQNRLPLYEALATNLGQAPFNKKPLKEFVELMEKLRLMAPALMVSELTDEMMKATGLADEYRNDTDEERLENISELINAMHDFEQSQDEPEDRNAAAYLHEIALYTNMDMPRSKSCVRLMTVHQAKGLEFPYVIVAGLSEGTFPSHRTIRERRKDGEEEERRLMYVAVTRAKKELYLTESEGFLNDTGAFKYPSRFLSEIPEKLLRHEGNWDPALMEGTRLTIRALEEEIGGAAHEALPVGTKVIHKIFGEGVVEAYNRQDDTYKIRFGSITRNLQPKAVHTLDSAN